MDEKKGHLVIFDPSLGGMGHLIPFCELAKLLASCHGFSITFIMTANIRPVGSAQTAYTQSLASSGLGIRFIELPADVQMDFEEKNAHPIVSIFKLVDKSRGLVEHALRTLLNDSSNPISVFITDLFGTAMLENRDRTHTKIYLITEENDYIYSLIHKQRFPKIVDLITAVEDTQEPLL